jgi:hypothetical protein
VLLATSVAIAADGSSTLAPADATPAVVNLVANAGFEQDINGWIYRSHADGDPQQIIEHVVTHSGKTALRFHIAKDTHYWIPSLDLTQRLKGLKPHTHYEMSVWSKTANATSVLFGVGGPDGHTEELPANSPAWIRSKFTFMTGDKDTSREIFLRSWRTADELLIDDVAVVEANPDRAYVYAPGVLAASDTPATGFALVPGIYNPESYERSEEISGTVTIPARSKGALSILVADASGKALSLASVDLPGAGEKSTSTISFCLPAAIIAHDGASIMARLSGMAEPLATVSIKRADFSDLFPVLANPLATRLAAMKSQAASAHLDGNAYVKLGLFVASHYLDRVSQNDITTLQTEYWTWLQLREVAQVLDATAILIRQPLPDVPPIPSGRARIDHGVFVAGTPPTPIFYGGYMGIEAKESPDYAALGISDTVFEGGPGSLARDGKDDWNSIGRLTSQFVLAKEANIKADMLLSPHNFPGWARKLAPDIGYGRHGGTDFVINHPIVRRVIEEWLRMVVPAVKDQPALMSFNLASEPDYMQSGWDAYSKPLWTAYISKLHGRIEVLNALYGTAYTAFDQVPVPQRGTEGKPAGLRRVHYDWINFNATNFGDWFRWMNGIVKQCAPESFTQVKLAGEILDGGLDAGIDHEEICRITDLAGCDGGTDGDGRQPMYAYNWRGNELNYDLLRSFRNQPIANSENHIIPDDYMPIVSSDYIRSTTWQSMVHGLAQSCVWGYGVWKRGEIGGGIKLRPADVFAIGRAWLDARRCASTVAAIVRAKPHIAILYSRSSIFWLADRYAFPAKAAYVALSLLGEPVTFVTEKQLAEGSAAPVRAILLPQVVNVSDSTIAALERFTAKGGKLIALGEGNLAKDEYDRPRNLSSSLIAHTITVSSNDDERALFDSLGQLAVDMGAPPALLDANTGERAFGIEYRLVGDRDHAYLSALNQLKKAQVVSLSYAGSMPIRDLLSGNRFNGTRIELEPMVPVLLDLEGHGPVK